MAKSLKIRSWLVVALATDTDAACSSDADAAVLDLSSTEPDLQDTALRFANVWTKARPDRPLAAFLPAFASGLTESVAAFAVELGVSTVFLPGTSGGRDVQRLDVALRVEELRAGRTPGNVAIVALADASGLLSAASFRRCSARLKGLGWDLPVDPASNTARLAGATIGLAALAAGVAAIHPVSSATDEEAFRSDCLMARENGFSEKLCRDPSQIPVVNDLFGDQPLQSAGRAIWNTSEPPSA